MREISPTTQPPLFASRNVHKSALLPIDANAEQIFDALRQHLEGETLSSHLTSLARALADPGIDHERPTAAPIRNLGLAQTQAAAISDIGGCSYRAIRLC
jgi:hypothetical protein